MLETSNGKENLHLPEEGDEVPGLERTHARQLLEGHARRRGEVSGEVNVVDMELKANNGSLRKIRRDVRL